jgi:hypothetical protein
MVPRMSNAELTLLTSFLCRSMHYVEVGTGGSTVLASDHVKSSVTSVDSSQLWLDKIKEACRTRHIDPTLLFVDIGPVGDWGVPQDPSTESRWANYHTNVWMIPGSADADLYLVDGRFRVACFSQIVLRCRADAIIGFHDFSSRPQYHCVREIAREIATAEDISFFLPRLNSRESAFNLLKRYRTEFN